MMRSYELSGRMLIKQMLHANLLNTEDIDPNAFYGKHVLADKLHAEERKTDMDPSTGKRTTDRTRG